MEDFAEELTLTDYVSRPLMELTSHPDFNPDVYAFVGALAGKTTAQLESLMERTNING